MKTLSLKDIKRIQNGDNAPLAEVYLENKSYCLLTLRKTQRFALEDIEDAYQEAIFILRTKIIEQKFENKNIASYVLTVTLNLLRNQYRKKKRVISFNGTEIKLYKIEDDTDNWTDEEEKKLQIIQEALKALSPKCQEFLTQYYKEVMSLKRMYEISDYSTYNSIKSTKCRCCKKFKDKLKETLDQYYAPIHSNG